MTPETMYDPLNPSAPLVYPVKPEIERAPPGFGSRFFARLQRIQRGQCATEGCHGMASREAAPNLVRGPFGPPVIADDDTPGDGTTPDHEYCAACNEPAVRDARRAREIEEHRLAGEMSARAEAADAVYREAKHAYERKALAWEAIMRIPIGDRDCAVNFAAIRQRLRRPEAAKEARAAHDAGVPVIVLAGPSGAGKTSCAAALYGHAARATITAETSIARFMTWCTAIEIASAARGQPLGHGPAKIVIEAINAPLLVVDDLGSESADTISCGAIMEILWGRVSHRNPTIITTGIEKERIAARYGAGMLRRLTDPQIATWIACA